MTLPPDEAARHRREWHDGAEATPRRRCPKCGAAFHTRVGPDEHVRLGCGTGARFPVKVRRMRPTPAELAARRQTGLAVVALNNSRQVRCDGCVLVSTPAGIGVHQRATGHVGRVEVR